MEIQFLSDLFKAYFFNGYDWFFDCRLDELEEFWFKNDGHLNQKGSDFLSTGVAQYLLSISAVNNK